MMKIIAIASSPRGKESNTLLLVQSAAEAAVSEGAEVEINDNVGNSAHSS